MKKLFCFCCFVAFLFAGCKGDAPPSPPLNDPQGTVTAWGSGNGNSYYVTYPMIVMRWEGDFRPDDNVRIAPFGWSAPGNLVSQPDNFTTLTAMHEGLNHTYTVSTDVMDVGPVASIASIRTKAGADWLKAVACDPGHGYLIRIVARTVERDSSAISPGDPGYWEQTQYVAVYAVETGRNADGVPFGAKIKYLYPFAGP
jgi:hypothetical protein